MRRPQPKTKTPGCMCQFLMAAIAAVALGYFMGTFLFQHKHPIPNEPNITVQQPIPEKSETTSNVSPNVSPKQETEDQGLAPAGSAHFPELHLFQVQVGSFSQKPNAERLRDKLLAQGWPVELVPAGNLTQVRAGFFFGRPAAESCKSIVSTDGVQAIVTEKVVTGRQVNYSAQDKDFYQLAPELAANLIEALTAAEEGRVKEAAAEVEELAQKAKDISILNEKKETVAMLQKISSILTNAGEAAASHNACAVSQGISVFVDWYQKL